jgi:hypothetical protein
MTGPPHGGETTAARRPTKLRRNSDWLPSGCWRYLKTSGATRRPPLHCATVSSAQQKDHRRRPVWVIKGCADNMSGTSEVPRLASRSTLCNAQVGRGGPGADYSALQRIPVTLTRLSSLSPAGSSPPLRLFFGMSRPPGISGCVLKRAPLTF